MSAGLSTILVEREKVGCSAGRQSCASCATEAPTGWTYGPTYVYTPDFPVTVPRDIGGHPRHRRRTRKTFRPRGGLCYRPVSSAYRKPPAPPPALSDPLAGQIFATMLCTDRALSWMTYSRSPVLPVLSDAMMEEGRAVANLPGKLIQERPTGWAPRRTVHCLPHSALPELSCR